jgi:small-conductance mechanosensitive channel
MYVDDKRKIDILINLLNERYDASHKMRERSLSFAVWILGLGIALIWLLLNMDISLSIFQKIILTIFIASIGCLTKKFLFSIETGFKNNREIMIRIEKILGFYEQDIYSKGESIYPESYKNVEDTKVSHFRSIYLWVYTIFIIIELLIWHDFVFRIIMGMFDIR